MIATWVLIILIITSILSLIQYNWQRRHLYFLASKLPGPKALPIIGNGLMFLCNTQDILKTVTNVISLYPKPFRIWFGPTLVIVFSSPNHIERILSSSKLAYKHDIYDKLIKIYLGDGLVSNSGPKYKKHRKLIQPLLNLKFATGNFGMFQKHINTLLDRFDERADGTNFDVHKLIHLCVSDIIGECIFGAQIGAQNGRNKDYIHVASEMYEVAFSRIMRPWLHPHVIYGFTQGNARQAQILETTKSFVGQIIKNSWQRINASDFEATESGPIVDQIAKVIQQDKSSMSDTDFEHHMYTLYVASEDTLTIITSMLCICFGMYPEYQALAVEELRTIMGKRTEITYDDISKMQYLDMCIRDVLRLIPIAPIIIRRTVEDTLIDDLSVPKNCGVLISIFDVHRDPEFWEFPNEFYPDHFLPETVAHRHPFAYVPFSAGPRGCVGKILAMIALKLIMANILQRFQIEADGKFPDIVLKADITVRSASGYDIRVKPRKLH